MIETDSFPSATDASLDRIISADKKSSQEEAIERALRPKRLAEYVGQAKIREQLSIFIEAARKRLAANEKITAVWCFHPGDNFH